MKVVTIIARTLLGIIFLFSGLNGFIHFGHAVTFKTEIARQFMTVMSATPYGHFLFGLQIVCGVLLLLGLFVPAAVTVLAGYFFNIYMFHIFFDPSRASVTVIATIFWIVTFIGYRSAFRPLLQPKMEIGAPTQAS
jgi:putative oxidoreductase